MVETSRFLFARHISKPLVYNSQVQIWKKIQMKKTFPSFDLEIDNLFPSEPEERKQKKEEQQRLLVI